LPEQAHTRKKAPRRGTVRIEGFHSNMSLSRLGCIILPNARAELILLALHAGNVAHDSTPHLDAP
jgi:hypothetical protein